MARQVPRRRKQRTREHVIADLSVLYVEQFIVEAGHTVQRLGSDYGYDLFMNTFDEQGYAEPGSVYFQCKAQESLKAIGTAYVYDLDIRDYHLWLHEKMPVILVLFDAGRREAYWLAMQHYFKTAPSRRPKKGAKHVRVRVLLHQALNPQAVSAICKLKRLAVEAAGGTAS